MPEGSGSVIQLWIKVLGAQRARAPTGFARWQSRHAKMSGPGDDPAGEMEDDAGDGAAPERVRYELRALASILSGVRRFPHV